MARSWRTSKVAVASFVCLLTCSLSALGWAQDGNENKDANEQGEKQEAASSLTSRHASEQESLPSEKTANQDTTQDYVIGPEDVLEIEVFNVPDLTKTVRVGNDGTISVALLHQVKAAGLTTRRLREVLEAEWGKTYLENPQVSVFVKEFHSQPVTVVGAVEKPGVYPITGPRTLIEMISLAGGQANRTSNPPGRWVFVTRAGGFGPLPAAEGLQLVAPDKLQIEIQRLFYSRDDSLNIAIQPHDIITVSKADIVYVLGAVRKPGGFVLEDRDRMTVMQALAMAEGLAPNSKRSAARIIRRSADGTKTELPIDLSRVLKGKAQDPELSSNDILYIPDSSEKAALKRGAEAVVATVSGVLIFRSSR